ncbi:MAG: hypothetical protein NO482_05470 [Candidatus Methanomethylicia archaeon]|nr:hypothetical protein [Candidatus Methanomethylicia archaeon]
MENLKETLASLKRGKVRPKACPRCGSVDVSVQTMTGYISQPTYVCNSCGFQGNIFLEIEKEKEKEKEKEEGREEGKEGGKKESVESRDH